MFISIVIPIYNVEKYIERCIRSVMNQDYKDKIECLLIDDCSPDDSCHVINNTLADYDGPITFKLIHHQENKGLSAARNTGIKHAKGEYVYFLDSDDYITPDCITCLAAPLLKKKYDLVIGNYTVLFSQKKFSSLMLGNREQHHNKDIFISYVKGEWYMMAWNKLCNLAFLRQHSLYFKEGLIHEDDLWSFQYACFARTLKSVDCSTYFYCVREGSIMNSLDKLDDERWKIKLIAYMADFINRHNLISYDKLKYVENLRNSYLDSWYYNLTIYDSKPLFRLLKNVCCISPYRLFKKQVITKKQLVRNLYHYLPRGLDFVYWRLSMFIKDFFFKDR